MPEEFDNNSENNYSTFWPMLILIIGLLGWSGYQDYTANQMRSAYNKQFVSATPQINEALGVSNRYLALMKDLVQTAQKDQYAAQIVKDAIKAGLIQVQPNATNAAGTPAAPAK